MKKGKKSTIQKLADQEYGINGSLASKLKPNDLVWMRKLEVRGAFSTNSQEHQRQVIRNIEGVYYINDSYACTLNALWYTLEETNPPIILITGGKDHGEDYLIIDQSLIKEKVKAIISLGEKNQSLLKHLNKIDIPIAMVEILEKAVELANYLSKPKDTILFSPGCASFDTFENYEERGEKFIEYVNAL